MQTVNFQFTLQTEDVPENVRDECAAWLKQHGAVVNAVCSASLPKFIVSGVDTDRRKKAPEPFQQTVEAEDADAAAAQFTGTMVVSSVVPVNV